MSNVKLPIKQRHIVQVNSKKKTLKRQHISCTNRIDKTDILKGKVHQLKFFWYFFASQKANRVYITIRPVHFLPLKNLRYNFCLWTFYSGSFLWPLANIIRQKIDFWWTLLWNTDIYLYIWTIKMVEIAIHCKKKSYILPPVNSWGCRIGPHPALEIYILLLLMHHKEIKNNLLT